MTKLGKTLAPPRFILFALLFPAAAFVAGRWLPASRALLAGFDVASLGFLLSLPPLFRRGEANQMRAAAQANDANRALLLAITGAVMLVILYAVANELRGKSDPAAIALVIATLTLAWLFSNIVYALHYAHLFYGGGGGGGGGDQAEAAGQLDFPDCDEPDYWDFVYFAFTLGMTFQTSDVSIKSRYLRRVAIGHCLAAFVFNLGVLAFTINVIGGG